MYAVARYEVLKGYDCKIVKSRAFNRIAFDRQFRAYPIAVVHYYASVWQICRVIVLYVFKLEATANIFALAVNLYVKVRFITSRRRFLLIHPAQAMGDDFVCFSVNNRKPHFGRNYRAVAFAAFVLVYAHKSVAEARSVAYGRTQPLRKTGMRLNLVNSVRSAHSGRVARKQVHRLCADKLKIVKVYPKLRVVNRISEHRKFIRYIPKAHFIRLQYRIQIASEHRFVVLVIRQSLNLARRRKRLARSKPIHIVKHIISFSLFFYRGYRPHIFRCPLRRR